MKQLRLNIKFCESQMQGMFAPIWKEYIRKIYTVKEPYCL